MTYLLEAAFPYKELRNLYDKGRRAEIPKSTRLYSEEPRGREAHISSNMKDSFKRDSGG